MKTLTDAQLKDLLEIKAEAEAVVKRMEAAQAIWSKKPKRKRAWKPKLKDYFTERDLEALRKALNEVEPHKHFEGMNECSVCDEPILRAAARVLKLYCDKVGSVDSLYQCKGETK